MLINNQDDNNIQSNIILRNRGTCMKCGDKIESLSRHDCVTCKCGECMVDGGLDYLRRNKTKHFKDESVTITSFEALDSKTIHTLIHDMQEWINMYEDRFNNEDDVNHLKRKLGLYRRFTMRWMPKILELSKGSDNA